MARPWVLAPGLLLLLAGCSPSPDQLKSALKKHPEILAEAIREHPAEIMEALQAASDSYQKVAQARAAVAEDERIGRELAAPKQPSLAGNRAIRGKPDAAVTIVIYSDFQCPFCRRDVPVLEALLRKYPDQLRLLLKQTPLPSHPYGRPAAEMFEALVRQDPAKAWRYHDLLFGNQERLGREGMAYLEWAARETGADLARARRDAAGPEVKAVIDADLAEFESFGFSGTPGFIINGVILDGAHPQEAFDRIIQRVLTPAAPPVEAPAP
jgi:protein-disulfide isomerase